MKPNQLTYMDFDMSGLVTQYFCTDGLNMPWRHLHSQYEILFVKEGTVVIDSNATTVTVSTPTVLVHKPFYLHRANAAEGSAYERYVINISPEFLGKIEALIPNFSIFISSQPAVIPLDAALTEETVTAFESIHADMKADRKSHALIKIALMLLKISEYATEQGIVAPDNDGYIDKIVRHISLHYADDIKIDRLADQFFVSRSKLISDFKKNVGVTIKKFVMFVRISNAQFFLAEGKSITETAQLCGFYDNSHFISTFRLLTGMTPRDFLKKKDQ